MASNSYDTPELNTKDLTVGQALMRVITTGGAWGAPIRRREVPVTVTKILKTRLVVEDAKGNETRVIVRSSDWAPGVVTRRIEGPAGGYRTYGGEEVVLFTTDDEKLVADRARVAEANKTHDVMLAAKTSARYASDDLDRTTAEAAIEALQAYLAHLDA